VDALTPLGTSTERIGAPRPFSASMSRAASSRGFPANPVPKSASTATSPPPGSANGIFSFLARSRFSLASPAILSSGPASTISTVLPASWSLRATTKPSPPLEPVPHQTAALPASG
jgi:hypothetical protein